MPRIGFLAQAQQIAYARGNARLVFNNRLDAWVTGFLMALVAVLLVESARQWLAILSGKRKPTTSESPFVPTRLAEEQT